MYSILYYGLVTSRRPCRQKYQLVVNSVCSRGATWVALHNGGGVGWGEVVNGGFGLVLDGSESQGRKAELMLGWDVSNGVSRRAWSGNNNADITIRQCSPLSLVQVQRGSALIGRKLQSVACTSNLMP